MSMNLYVTCARGLEPLLRKELVDLGYSKAVLGFRGVQLFFPNAEDTMQAVYRVNYLSRIAMRVLYPIKKFNVRKTDDLYNQVKRVDWNAFLRTDQTFAIQSNVSNNRSFDTNLFATQLTKDAIADYFFNQQNKRPSVDKENPDLQINLYINSEDAVLSLDTSGIPLYKRGYKESNSEASLAENLAAALLQLANWTDKSLSNGAVFCDPFVGSGTLLTEAMMIASNMPAGYKRAKYGFFSLEGFNEQMWLDMKQKEDAKMISIPDAHKDLRFMGADIDPEALKMTRENLKALKMENKVKLTCKSITEYEPPVAPNFVICNPPYGIRLNSEQELELQATYKALSDFLKKKTAKPAHGHVLTTKPLGTYIRLAPTAKHVIFNGGIETRLFGFEMYEGTRRKDKLQPESQSHSNNNAESSNHNAKDDAKINKI